MQMGMRRQNIGVIFPNEQDVVYELADSIFVRRWLSGHGLEVGYALACTPGGRVLTRQDCAMIASDEWLLPAAGSLASQEADVIMWACVCGSFYGGFEHARRQAESIAEYAGRTASSASLAILAAIEATGDKRVDIMTAYSPRVAALMVEFFKEAGVQIGHVQQIVRKPGQRLFDLDCASAIKEFAKVTADHEHPIIIPSTSLNSLDRIEEFEALAGRCVITANLACLWYATRLLGEKVQIEGAGRIFKQSPDNRRELPAP
jgi:maleate cis-trans isomerase